MLIKDLIEFRKRTDNENIEVNVEKENKQDRGFMTIIYTLQKRH